MKRRFLSLLTFMCVMLLTTTAMAALEINKIEDMDHHKYLKKFKRGAINVITSPVEVPKQIKAEYDASKSKEKTGSRVAAIFGGTFKGIAYFGGRLGSGLWDMVTCNWNHPKNYEPLMKPNFVMEQDEIPVYKEFNKEK